MKYSRNTWQALNVGLSGLFAALTVYPHGASYAGSTNIVDFRYSPPEWQTAICLPDDRSKTLVDKSGALLYHYGQGNREFGTRISVEVSDRAVWQKQDLYSPRVPVVRTYHMAPGVSICRYGSRPGSRG